MNGAGDESASMVSASIIDCIGATPLVDLSRMAVRLNGRILLKLEFLNPGFSKKDRAALQIIEDAERTGELKQGQTVVELTSGNMGTGLAIVCGVKGYPFVAVMSKGNTPERATMMRALGAEVVLVDQAEGSSVGEVSGADLLLVERETQKIVVERNAYRADQFNLPGNRDAHYFGTAAEIWQQTNGEIGGFCDFAGSGGTFAGCSRFFKEQNAGIQCYVIEPESAAALKGAAVTCADHPIQGGGYAMHELSQMEGATPDGFLTVDPKIAMDCSRRLAREEGIFAGISTGANLAAAIQLLEGPLSGSTIVTVACDSGLKYLSTGLWDT